MEQRIAVGIDLGTTTTGLAYVTDRHRHPRVLPHGRGRSMMPSIVGTNLHDRRVVGWDAAAFRALRVDDGDARVEVRPGESVSETKRVMGSNAEIVLAGQIHTPQEIAALILRHIKSWAEQSLATTISDVVLSVPANFPDAAKAATQQAARLAGLSSVRLISEPTAAALAFGFDRTELDEQLLVFDFGGGTLDITVLEMMDGVFDIQNSFGDGHLGGSDFDAVLEKLLVDKFKASNPGVAVSAESMNELRATAEQAKIALSSELSHRVVIRNFARSADGDPIDLVVEVTRDQFEAAADGVLRSVRECLRGALSAKGFRPSAIQRILLVGGSTRVPAVRRILTETFGFEPKADVDADTAVCQGAAIQAAIISGMWEGDDAPILADVAPFGLGVRVVGFVGNHLMTDLYSPLMSPNTSIPHTAQHRFHLTHPDQEAVEVEVFQDHSGRAQLVDEADDTGLRGTIEEIPPSLSGEPHELEVDFSYDVDGLIRIEARVVGLDKSVSISMDKSAKRLSEAEEQEAQARVDEAWRTTAAFSEVEPIISRADEFMALLGAEDAARVAAACAALKIAVAAEGTSHSEALNQLTDILFDMEELAYG